ncbi:hypothetical protein JDV02_000970 [Purpureocillium takamizusanense]|nr:uncharacterized protein JDV02_000970 [Purpureocillium takamizusanense]UNI14333.1 hypothetical protein JDV02_000970 [Purpureocillium takamizusanense]
MILDVLFIYCKTNPDRGGYRQGMHELLAPIVHVVQQDAVSRSATTTEAFDEEMLDHLDADFVEHDAYILFSRLMERAKAFYEIKDAPDQGHAEQRSTIVERSKYIHEACLQRVDQELANHLQNIEILPQIFLIRWIRLLFSREFPFDQFLALWDTVFAIDPSLDLIDLICCAMLIRIRWQLLEADYSVCLQLLLKYPPPEQAHGPHTFVDDALYIRKHMTAAGGAVLIQKYTGRMPDLSEKPYLPPPSTGNSQRTSSRPSLPSPSKFIQQQGRVESLFQGAAKGARGVLERGEKLGINQAVRDAMVEIRRNVQNFNESQQVQHTPRQVLSEYGAVKALAAMEGRNKQLASLLNEAVLDLKTMSLSNVGDGDKNQELLEVVAAKIQFVQVYLEDPSMEVPSFNAAPSKEPEARQRATQKRTTEPGLQTTESENSAEPESTEPMPGPPEDHDDVPVTNAAQVPHDDLLEPPTPGGVLAFKTEISSKMTAPKRPAAIPTRSTLAQSSFSWMLEPDESVPARTTSASGRSPQLQHKKRSSNNAGRERNAFLFGENDAESESNGSRKPDDIFGLEPLGKPQGTSQGKA